MAAWRPAVDTAAPACGRTCRRADGAAVTCPRRPRVQAAGPPLDRPRDRGAGRSRDRPAGHRPPGRPGQRPRAAVDRRQNPRSRSRSTLWSLPRPVLATPGDENTTLLVPVPGDDLGPTLDVARRARELYAERLDPALREHVVVGIGAPRPDLAAARASRQEARLAPASAGIGAAAALSLGCPTWPRLMRARPGNHRTALLWRIIPLPAVRSAPPVARGDTSWLSSACSDS